MHKLPETGYLRLSQIIGNPRAKPPIPPIIPVSRSSWWDGVRSGRFPKPVKLGPRTTAWPVEAIRALIDAMNQASQVPKKHDEVPHKTINGEATA